MRRTKLNPGEMLYVKTEFGTVRLDAPRPGVNDLNYASIHIDLDRAWVVEMTDHDNQLNEILYVFKQI